MISFTFKRLELFAIIILLSTFFMFLLAAESDFNTLTMAKNLGQYENKKIKTINVEGNLVLTTKQVKDNFPIKENDIFKREEIDKAIKTLFDTGSFDRIAIDTVIEDNGELILTIVVLERPVIKNITFVGNKKLKRGALLDTIEPYLEIGKPYLEQNLNDAVNSMITNYQDKGYLKAYVNPKVSVDADKSYINIEMNVEEGNEVKIAEVRFYGNTQFTANQLKGQMSTKETGFLSLGKFEDLKFEEDKDKLIKYYKDRGYYHAKIDSIRLNYQWRDPKKKDDQDLIIDVYLTEGEKYYFGDISFKGNYVISSEDIERDIIAKKGSLYDFTEHMVDFQGIQAKYSDSGYIFRQVIPVITVNEDIKTVSIMYDIVENDKAHIESIIITGNTKTKDFVIERYIDIKPGEIFNSSKIQRVQERLNNTQFFEDIQIGVKPGEAEGLMGLTFNLTEGRTAMISGGAGFSTSSGFTVFAELRELNFLGLGMQVGINGEFGEDQKGIGLNFAEPYLFNLPIYLGADVSYFHEDVNTGVEIDKDQFGNPEYSYYTRHGFELILRTGYYFLDYFSTFFTFNTLFMQYQQWDDQGANGSGPKNVIFDVAKDLTHRVPGKGNFPARWESDWFTTFILSHSISRDSRNDYLNPTKGGLLRFQTDLYFGHTEVTRINATAFWAVPLAKWISLAFYGEIGQIFNGATGQIKNDGDILYYLNPFEDIRGWDTSVYTKFKQNRGFSTYKNIDVQDGVTNINDFSYGRAQVRFFAEARIPIIPKTLGFVTFLDVGQLWLPDASSILGPNGETVYPSEFIGIGDIFDPSQYMYSVGAGLRLTIPIFNIRVYVAKRFVYNKTDIGFGEGFQDFEGDTYSPLGKWLGRGWSIAFTMNHPFY